MKKFIPLAIATALVFGACSSGPKHTENDAKDAIAAAEAETKTAKAKGFEWRDTGKMIKKAQEALKNGDIDEAVKLANKAKRQSSNAIAQAADSANAKPNFQ